jgi:hypothetical protein
MEPKNGKIWRCISLCPNFKRVKVGMFLDLTEKYLYQTQEATSSQAQLMTWERTFGQAQISNSLNGKVYVAPCKAVLFWKLA